MDQNFKKIEEIVNSNDLPDFLEFKNELLETIESQKQIPEDIRPKDKSESPGGLLKIPPQKPVILIPDLHGRFFFLKKVLLLKNHSSSVYDDLKNNLINIICLGDAMHTETDTGERWRSAYYEYLTGFKEDLNMKSEMVENLKTLRIIMILLKEFPTNFFFLKGNHENILNNDKNGNHIFGKFVYEGEMVNSWMKKVYGDEIIDLIYQLEMSFPLLAVSKNFMVSHSEPVDFYNKEKVINYKTNPDVVEGLTWTQKGDLMDDCVKRMMSEFIPKSKINTYYFAGHRAVRGKFHLRKKDNFVQIHNPEKQNIVMIKSDREININSVIYTLD